mmetsp:Transcript_44515/g.123783  ORF Transcript_44515/g.123783 Transcript_44515/m.123783 type:complete len:207 (-) Transcript_44515:89-709(-)
MPEGADPPQHVARGPAIAHECSDQQCPPQQRTVHEECRPSKHHVGLRHGHRRRHLRKRPLQRAPAGQHQQQRHREEPLEVAERVDGPVGQAGGSRMGPRAFTRGENGHRGDEHEEDRAQQQPRHALVPHGPDGRPAAARLEEPSQEHRRFPQPEHTQSDDHEAVVPPRSSPVELGALGHPVAIPGRHEPPGHERQRRSCQAEEHRL